MTQNPNRIEKQTLQDDPELTKLGKFIRRFKIDELPQLWNIVKGDMSFIGPRPCLPTLAEKFDENGKTRIMVRPGLTGLAQINGNINLTWPERWVYDRQYVESLSFTLDCKIIMKTVAVVLLGENRFTRKST
jgi:lipopolysaccharide/colanic/teichoic acid biosynthesis glycosyltransferase